MKPCKVCGGTKQYRARISWADGCETVAASYQSRTDAIEKARAFHTHEQPRHHLGNWVVDVLVEPIERPER